MARSRGSNVKALIRQESSYGAVAAGDWVNVAFLSSDIGAEQNLINPEILGEGREPQEPFYDVVDERGRLSVPVDMVLFGYWLRFLLGAETSADVGAEGTIKFPGNPAASDTITINGTVFTFVSGTPGSDEIQIGATLPDTLDNIIAELNGSSDTDVDDATYTEDGVDTLTVTHDTAGTGGQSFTIAASAATASAATLAGGRKHTWGSGSSSLLSFQSEIGHSLASLFFINKGLMLNSMALNFQRSGVAKADLDIIGQNEVKGTSTVDASPITKTLELVSQFQGSVRMDGGSIANITAAALNYTNNLEAIDGLEGDGLIQGIDPTNVEVTGTISARFGDATLIDKATSQTPVSLVFQYTLKPGFRLVITVHRVFLPRKKQAVEGPAGVSASFDWRAAYDSGESQSMKVELFNGETGYAPA